MHPAPQEWIPLQTADGSWTLLAPVHQEACHSVHGAWTQATQRYAAGCRLRERARESGRSALSLCDVGTGLGLNLAAALEALQGTGVVLLAESFEHSRSVLEQALRLPHVGPGSASVRSVRRSLARALEQLGAGAESGVAEVELGDGGRLRLELGDARVRLLRRPHRPGYDAVFLDPFSPRVAPELWSGEFLQALAERMAPGSWLCTYSAAIEVRLALLRTGLRVGLGPRVGTKAQGTLASPDQSVPPFEARTARRLERRAAALH